MSKVTGIKSVDFKIKAYGYGVVNWNGPTDLEIIIDNKSKKVTNHSMPKLRGYTNIRGYWDDGKPQFKRPEEVDFSKTPLYISQNCIRHHLFKDEAINLQTKDLLDHIINHMDNFLCSITALVRGYVIPSKEFKRTSPLLLTDFEEVKMMGNFEQLGNSGSKDKKETKTGKEASTAIFSKTTFGDTSYEGYGSISIEQLQFISLSADYGREAMKIDNHKDGAKLAETLTSYIQNMLGNKQVKAEYHQNYVRQGAIFTHGEAGILLNEEAIDTLVKITLDLFRNLVIKQAKGYMYVDSIEVDYNDGSTAKDMMRIKHSPMNVTPQKNSQYAVYFKAA